jgi:hypothetical protein
MPCALAGNGRGRLLIAGFVDVREMAKPSFINLWNAYPGQLAPRYARSFSQDDVRQTCSWGIS